MLQHGRLQTQHFKYICCSNRSSVCFCRFCRFFFFFAWISLYRQMNMISQRKKKMQAFRNRDEQKSNIIDLESHTTRVLFSSLMPITVYWLGELGTTLQWSPKGQEARGVRHGVNKWTVQPDYLHLSHFIGGWTWKIAQRIISYCAV